uniref:Nrf1_activ_bdg domain-containing protein n=1 Tax=Glossina brevipalpis TaxID=37001 RepID=A0A1A9WFQ9_9MUSC
MNGSLFDLANIEHTQWEVENGDQLETITVSPGVHQMMIQGAPGQEPQVLQVVSLKDGTLLSKAVEVITSGNNKSYEELRKKIVETLSSRLYLPLYICYYYLKEMSLNIVKIFFDV